MRYSINRVKPQSNAMRYNTLRDIGMKIRVGRKTVTLKGAELDEYLDIQAFRKRYPGQPEVEHFDVLPRV